MPTNSFVTRAQITGFAEIADIRTKHTKELIEKHYSQNTPGDKWKGLKITNDYLELLDDKSLDAVLIATPDHWHGEATIRAARAKSMYIVKNRSRLNNQRGSCNGECRQRK